MATNVKVPFQGAMVDGVEMDFKTIREEWNEYQISDGSTIRVKLVMTNIVKLKDKHDQTGTPIYSVKSSNVLAVSVPEKSNKGNTVS
jgi:hypothetical protein